MKEWTLQDGRAIIASLMVLSRNDKNISSVIIYKKVYHVDIKSLLSRICAFVIKEASKMFHAMQGIFCFVTAAVSFIYGTRVAWVCGKKCQFREKPETRKELLLESLPAAIAIYFIGFVVVFIVVLDGFISVTVFSLISAIVLANLVVSMAMPELKRKPRDK